MHRPHIFGLTSIFLLTYFFSAPSALAEVLSSDLNNNGISDSEESEVIVSASTFLFAGEYNFQNLVIKPGATFTLRGNELSPESFKGVKINATNIIIETGATISANAQGYKDGPGAPTTTFGGANHNYGSAIRPVDLGSGGGGGNNRGGGAIWFEVSNKFQNNGAMYANGNSSSSGGSVYINTKEISGNGFIYANGGGRDVGCSTACASGGGGRIAIYYENSSLSGTAEAKGGCGSYDGFSQTCSQDGTAGFFDTINNDLLIKSSWKFRSDDSPFSLNEILFTDQAVVSFEPGASVTATSLAIEGASVLTLSGEETLIAESLILKGNSTITVLPERVLLLEIPNIIVEAGSRISANAKGYIIGPGTPNAVNSAGASYGGKGGGALAKPTYGSAEAPVDFGSGRGDSTTRRGGGAIRIIAETSLQNDGQITASSVVDTSTGIVNSSERGSGGSIYVTAGKVSGGGSFKADGANTAWPYAWIAGGGGRVAIYYKANTFTGTVTAKGGIYCFYGCAPAAENGTVVIAESVPEKNPVIIIPGVLGTEIFNGAEKLWLDVGRTAGDIGDQFLDDLAFNSQLEPLQNNLSLGDILTKVPGFNYSTGLVAELQNQGYIEEVDLFTLPYDWRYGINNTNIQALKEKIANIKTETNAKKVDIVAHSTGGLLVKKYIQENPSTHNIDKTIFVGVPNTGAPKAIKTLLVGDGFGNIFLSDKEMKKLAKNLPVVYDLAPSSTYYDRKGSYVSIITEYLSSTEIKNLTFEETKNFLISDHGLNSQAITNANNLHAPSFDNFDMRDTGVDFYNITGCKAGTMGTIVEHRVGSKSGYLRPKYILGDGTVPLESATNVPVDERNRYFALKGEHGTMLTQDGIRQLITGIFTDTGYENENLITQDISKCELNGRAVAIYSPVSIDVTDQDGNHLGLSADGVSTENYIPNASFDIMDEEKFVYLPTEEGQQYSISLRGTGIGTFTISDAKIESNEIVQEQKFLNIPVTTQTTGEIIFENNTSTIKLDVTGDGVSDFSITPSGEFNPALYLQIVKTTINSLDLPLAKKKSFGNKIDSIIKKIEQGKIGKATMKAEKFAIKLEKKIAKPNPKKPKPNQISKTDAQLILDMFNNLLDNLN